MGGGRPSQQYCRVCDDKAHGVHFDVDTCRACAAFFRRSVCRVGSSYVCKSDGRCPINSGLNTSCKACRYARCQQLGMNMQSIQLNRDPIGKKADSTPSPPSTTTEIRTDILSRMDAAYIKMEQDRRVIHQRGDILKVQGRSVSIQETNMIFIRDSPLVFRFLLESFPRLQEMQSKQLERFFGACYMSFTLIESIYNSTRQKGDLCHKQNLLPSGDFIDGDSPKNFYGFTDSQKFMTREEALRLFGPEFLNHNRRLFTPFKRFGLSYYEFLALAAVVAWEPGNPMLPEADDELCRSTRLSVCSELLSIYKSEGRSDEAERLAGLLIYLPSLKKCVNEMLATVYTSRTFDIYSIDNKFFDLINIQA